MTPAEVIAEFKDALDNASGPRHNVICGQVLDLYLLHADHYSDEQIALFDDVLAHLLGKSQRPTYLMLSAALAPLPRGPQRTLAMLARHPDLAVSGPVLEHSPALRDVDLAEIARQASPAQLTAICNRTALNEPVTEVLIERGIADLTRKILANEHAKLSEISFARMLSSGADRDLKVAISMRRDLPDELRPWVKDVAGT